MIHSPNFSHRHSLAFDSRAESHCLVLRSKLSETIPLRRRVVLRLNHWCVFQLSITVGGPLTSPVS
jgi:hypothetical protein